MIAPAERITSVVRYVRGEWRYQVFVDGESFASGTARTAAACVRSAANYALTIAHHETAAPEGAQ